MAEPAALDAAIPIVQLVFYANSISGQGNAICEHRSTEQLSRLKSFNDGLIALPKVSLQMIFHSGKITRLTQFLERNRSELGLHILAIVNAKNDAVPDVQAKLPELVKRSKDDIFEVITITEHSLLAQLKEFGRYTSRANAKLNGKLIATIFKMRDERISNTDVDYTGERIPDWEQSAVAFSSNDAVSMGVPLHSAAIMVDDHYTAVSNTVLDLLLFRQITDFMQDLSAAYKNTFNRIYAPIQPHVSL